MSTAVPGTLERPSLEFRPTDSQLITVHPRDPASRQHGRLVDPGTAGCQQLDSDAPESAPCTCSGKHPPPARASVSRVPSHRPCPAAHSTACSGSTELLHQACPAEGAGLSKAGVCDGAERNSRDSAAMQACDPQKLPAVRSNKNTRRLLLLLRRLRPGTLSVVKASRHRTVPSEVHGIAATAPAWLRRFALVCRRRTVHCSGEVL